MRNRLADILINCQSFFIYKHYFIYPLKQVSKRYLHFLLALIDEIATK